MRLKFLGCSKYTTSSVSFGYKIFVFKKTSIFKPFNVSRLYFRRFVRNIKYLLKTMKFFRLYRYKRSNTEKCPFYQTINDMSNGSFRSNKPKTQRKSALTDLIIIVVTLRYYLNVSEETRKHICVRQMIRLQYRILCSLRHPVTVIRYETQ